MSTSTISSPTSPPSAPLSSPLRRPPMRSKSKSFSLPPLPLLTRSAGSSPVKRILTPSTPYFRTSSASASDTPGGRRLPATDGMSYFPPFEEMGGMYGSNSEAGPSVNPIHTCGQEGHGASHGKNKSLGSLANFISWATFSPASEEAPSTRHELGSSPQSRSSRTARSSSPRRIRPQSTPIPPARVNDDCLQALNRHLTPGPGKRRVLEPISANDTIQSVSLSGLTTGMSVPVASDRQGEGFRQKNRRVEAEQLATPGSSGASVSGIRGRSGGDRGTEERMDGKTSARLQRQRNHLSLPPPSISLPNWRFPIPSPPIASLSTHIPTELFQFEISNPASAASSPTKQSASFADFYTQHRAHLHLTSDEISTFADRESEETEGSAMWSDGSDPETGLNYVARSDSSTSSGSSAASVIGSLATPCEASLATLERDRRWQHRSVQAGVSLPRRSLSSDSGDETLNEIHLAAAHNVTMQQSDADDDDQPFELLLLPERLKLRRTSSSGSKASCDSAKTVRPAGMEREGEITPRAGKRWRAGYV